MEQENTTAKQSFGNAETTSPRSGGLGGRGSSGRGSSACASSACGSSGHASSGRPSSFSGLQYANPILYKSLRENAIYMREHPTEAESHLWQLLKSNPFGLRFRHQYVIDEYIVDFIALRQKLVIEIDGGYHGEDMQIEKDKERDARLKSLGFNTLRFSNEDVYGNSEWILKAIQAEIHN